MKPGAEEYVTPCPHGPHEVIKGCVFCKLEDASEQARIAVQALRDQRDNNAIVAKVLQDVCDLPYDSPDDDPLLLQCTSSELQAILRRALGEDV